jgi:hypothetical protein
MSRQYQSWTRHWSPRAFCAQPFIGAPNTLQDQLAVINNQNRGLSVWILDGTDNLSYTVFPDQQSDYFIGTVGNNPGFNALMTPPAVLANGNTTLASLQVYNVDVTLTNTSNGTNVLLSFSVSVCGFSPSVSSMAGISNLQDQLNNLALYNLDGSFVSAPSYTKQYVLQAPENGRAFVTTFVFSAPLTIQSGQYLHLTGQYSFEYQPGDDV